MTYVRSVALCLIACLMLGAAPVPSGGADAGYAALAHAYFYNGFVLNPIEATSVGVHDYDAQIGDFSAAGFAKRIAAGHAYLAKLSAIDRSQLSPSVALDATLMEYKIRDELLLDQTLQRWRHNPDGYTQAASDAIFSVMSKNYAPLATRMRYAIARERLIPAMLAQAEKNITSVDAVTKSISAQDAAGAVGFFKTSVPEAFGSAADSALQAQFKSANAEAAAAMGSYAAWIGKIEPSGTFAIGADAYRKLLLYEDALSVPLDQYLAIGEQALAATHAQFVAAARKIDPHATPQQVYASITKIHPAADQLLTTAASDLVKLRAFVEGRHIVTLPPNANIKVIETPPFERTIISAAEDSPGPLETVATQAYYYQEAAQCSSHTASPAVGWW